MGMTYKSITWTSGLCLKVVSYSNGGVVVVAVWIELRTGVRHAVAASGTSLFVAVNLTEENLLGSYWLFLRSPPGDRQTKAPAFDSPSGVPISHSDFLKIPCRSSWCNARSKGMSCRCLVGDTRKAAGYLKDLNLK